MQLSHNLDNVIKKNEQIYIVCAIMMCINPIGKCFFHTVSEIVTFTAPLKTNILFSVCYSNFHYPYNQTPFFLIFFETFSLLPNAMLSSPPEFSAPLLSDLSSWSHESLSSESFSSIEVWSLKELGFESVDLRSDLGFI